MLSKDIISVPNNGQAEYLFINCLH